MDRDARDHEFLAMTISQIVTITFTPNTGNPVTVTRFLPAGGPVLESVQTMFGFSAAYQEGWVKVSGTSR
jgi:hypothetical protein